MIAVAQYSISFGLTWAITIWLILTVATFLHELAHAVAARYAGLKPLRVDVGDTPWILSRRLGGIDWRIGLRPFGGLTTVASMRRLSTWRHVMYAGAGLCSDLVVLLLVAWGYEQSVASNALPSSVTTALRHALILEAIAFLYSAIPMSSRGPGGIPNDAYQILEILRGNHPNPAKDGDRYVQHVRRYDPAFSLDESWLLCDDADLERHWKEWRFRLANRQFNRAVAAFSQFISSDRIKGGERAVYLDEMATLAVVDGHKELLPYALEWAREARQVAPSARTLLGTHGSVLVESGEIEAGIALLSSLTTVDDDPNDRAIATCYLAKAHHKLGNPEKSRRLLEEARNLRPPVALLDRIAGEIRAPASPGS